MSATILLREDQVLTTLGNWAQSVLGNGFNVIVGQVNRVPPFPSGSNFAVMTPLSRTGLSTNQKLYTDDTIANVHTRTTTRGTEYEVQFDLFGPDASDQIQVLSTLFKDFSGTEWFKASGISAAPLFATEPRQMVFTNEHQQYEDRWSMDFHLQINPGVVLAQEFADELNIATIIADT